MRIAIAGALGLDATIEPLRTVLESHLAHEVVWTAATPDEALQLAARQRPDVLLVSLSISGMGAVELTRRVMRDAPCAVLLVATSIEGDHARVFHAMGEGALDVVEVSPSELTAREGAGALAGKLDTIRKLIGEQRSKPSIATLAPSSGTRLLAIGASAGGPNALAKVFAALPTSYPAAVVVVQHVDTMFAASMAEWLSRQSAWPVRIAQEGERPAVGTVLLAGSDGHLVLKSAERLGYTPEPADYPYRPSVDALFHSVTRHWEGEAIGVLLTGMGRDGSAGLKALRDRGHHTIAQDEASSAVYGMPKAAAKLNAAIDILPLDEIAHRLSRLAGLKRG